MKMQKICLVFLAYTNIFGIGDFAFINTQEISYNNPKSEEFLQLGRQLSAQWKLVADLENELDILIWKTIQADPEYRFLIGSAQLNVIYKRISDSLQDLYDNPSANTMLLDDWVKNENNRDTAYKVLIKIVWIRFRAELTRLTKLISAYDKLRLELEKEKKEQSV